MITPNFAAEGRIREACAIAGMKEAALEDVVTRFRANQFTEAELPEKIEEWRNTPGHHFFSSSGADEQSEAVTAFGPHRTLTAQGLYVRKHGEAKAREVAEQFRTTLGGKPGTAPEWIKPPKQADDVKVPSTVNKGRNPWAEGSFNITEQGRLIKALGEAKAAQIAKAAGSFIGATRPAKVTA